MAGNGVGRKKKARLYLPHEQGLSRAERNELDRRYDRLSAQVRYERRDNDNRRDR